MFITVYITVNRDQPLTTRHTGVLLRSHAAAAWDGQPVLQGRELPTAFHVRQEQNRHYSVGKMSKSSHTQSRFDSACAPCGEGTTKIKRPTAGTIAIRDEPIKHAHSENNS